MKVKCIMCGSDRFVESYGQIKCQKCNAHYSMVEYLNMRSDLEKAENPSAITKAPEYYRNKNLGVRHITTKDLFIGPASDILKRYRFTEYNNDPGRGYYMHNTAAVLYENNTYLFGAYNYERKVYIETATIKEPEEKTIEGFKYYLDGYRELSHNSGFYGFEYNLLKCMIDLVSDLAPGSSIVSVPNSEKNTILLQSAMNISKPEWVSPGLLGDYARNDSNYVDNKKMQLVNQLRQICTEKSIMFDVVPHYVEMLDVKKVGKTSHVYRDHDGDDRIWEHDLYLVEYADGHTQEYIMPEDAEKESEKYGVKVPERLKKMKYSLL